MDKSQNPFAAIVGGLIGPVLELVKYAGARMAAAILFAGGSLGIVYLTLADDSVTAPMEVLVALIVAPAVVLVAAVASRGWTDRFGKMPHGAAVVPPVNEERESDDPNAIEA